MVPKEQENVDQAPSTDHAPAKRPYTAPRLRRLGSVRELTLGATMGMMVDALGGMMQM